MGLGLDLNALKQKILPILEANRKASEPPVAAAQVREKTAAELEAQKAAELAAAKQAELAELTMQQEIAERIREFNRRAGNDRD
jgi:hypothetical protein